MWTGTKTGILRLRVDSESQTLLLRVRLDSASFVTVGEGTSQLTLPPSASARWISAPWTLLTPDLLYARAALGICDTTTLPPRGAR